MPESRIDESAARVVQLKKTLGLLSQPVPPLSHPYLHTVGAAGDRAVWRGARPGPTPWHCLSHLGGLLQRCDGVGRRWLERRRL